LHAGNFFSYPRLWISVDAVLLSPSSGQNSPSHADDTGSEIFRTVGALYTNITTTISTHTHTHTHTM